MPEGTTELKLTYDRPIRLNHAEQIRVLRDQKVLEGVQAAAEGNSLVVTLPEPLEKGGSVTLVVPRGAAADAENPQIIYNSNGIYGFAG